MHRIAIAFVVCMVACLAGARASAPSRIGLSEADEHILLEAKVVRFDGGSQYHSYGIRVENVVSKPAGIRLKSEMDVFILGWEPALPPDTPLLLVLSRYNPKRDDLWKVDSWKKL